MRWKAFRLGMCVVALGFVVACMTPIGSAQSTNKFAALIVASSYREAGDTYQLNNTINDARLVADRLGELDDTFSSVTTLLDGDKDQFREALEQFGTQLDENTTAVFYFAGHGIQVDGHNYLLPSDLDGVIPAGAVTQYLQSRARGVIIVIDACRNNPLASLKKGELNLTEVGIPGLATRGLSVRPRYLESSGLAKMEIKGARVMVVFATDPGDVALDELPGTQNSPFSNAFAGNILQQKSFEEVLADVSRELERYAQSRPGLKKQTPWRQSSWTEPLYLAGKPPAFSSTGVSMPPP